MTQHEQKTESLVCEICSFETKSEESLKRHIRRHENRIKCDLCEYSSERAEYVEKHGNDAETRFKCDMCDTYIRSKVALKQHKYRYH